MMKEIMPPNKLLTYLMQRDRFAYAQTDESLHITAVSDNLSQLLNLPHDPVGELVTGIFTELVGVEPLLRVIAHGLDQSYRLEEVQRVRADGSTLYYNIQLVSLDTSLGLLAIVENMSGEGTLKQELVQERNELRLAKTRLTEANDRLRQLDQFKNMFLSMAAHDLRTPLFVISGYLQMMLMESVPEEQHELLSNALLQIQWLDHLVLDFLSLDKIERGEMVITPSSFDLVRLVHSVTQLFLSVIESKQQTLLVEMPEDRTAVWGEEGRVRQVIFNLVSNATKYSLTSSIIRILVNVEGEQVVLQVADNGPGLTADELDLIFIPYYRSGAARQENISGTGLGLFITKMLVEAHGGTIAVQSEVGEGSLFTIRLPRPPAAE
ncbi:MAG: HAMP domain-containing sensor histidine kinase [Chloroflexota bacterium]